METLLALLPPIVYIPYDAKDEKLYEFVRSRMDRIVTEYNREEDVSGIPYLCPAD